VIRTGLALDAENNREGREETRTRSSPNFGSGKIGRGTSFSEASRALANFAVSNRSIS